MPSRREVWMSMLVALGAGGVGGFWVSSLPIDAPEVAAGTTEDARPGEVFWEGADPGLSGVRVLDVVHDLNNAACRRGRPALEALVRATSGIALRWRDWPTGGEESWSAAVMLRALAMADRRTAIELLHQSGAWEGVVTARRLRSAWKGSRAEAHLAAAAISVSADAAWAQSLGLRAPPSILEGDRLLGVGALSAEVWRERLGISD